MASFDEGAVAFAKALSPDLRPRLNAVGQGLLLVSEEIAGDIGCPHLVCDNPRLAFGQVVEEFFAPQPSGTVDPSARIDLSARLGRNVTVGAFTWIGPGVSIGEGTEIRHHVVIGRNVQIGRYCLIKSHSVIGEEGFGLERDHDGNNVRLPHLGSVVIGDHVEIGALDVVCSGTIEPTRICDHVKMDDAVFVAHNAFVGANSILIAGAAIGGSARIGENVWVGLQASVIQKIEIGDGALIGMGSAVNRSIPPNVVATGVPARVLRPRTTTE
ncbi:MAG: DapH/DapD/GlmU-related protein [Defluviicoccus sp.]|nr:DapH/DapD/GlmU-related protein [Defluviicoccus sp.]MDG4610068.1 DapH/DapD/GlmU-related protein [Defluviicoccus sp.]